MIDELPAQNRSGWAYIRMRGTRCENFHNAATRTMPSTFILRSFGDAEIGTKMFRQGIVTYKCLDRVLLHTNV